MITDKRPEPVPIEIKLDRSHRQLSVTFDDGVCYEMTTEYLRVHSPSAEVKGHGGGAGVLQKGKQEVRIKDISPIGNYAVRLIFDDGHSTGLYTWKLLYELGRDRDENWRTYLARVAESGSGSTIAPAGSAPGCAGSIRRPQS